MKLWKDIETALNEELPPEVIEAPNQRSGIYGSWVKGHTIMELANAVFGPDGWTTNIVSPPKVDKQVVGIHQSGAEREGLVVTVIVQVTGHGLDDKGREIAITKTDMGYGTASQSFNRQAGRYEPLKPAQYRPAILGAITIGFKRCLSQFGRKLGMQLYIPDEDQMAMGWDEGEPSAAQRAQQQPPAQQPQQGPPPVRPSLRQQPAPQTTRRVPMDIPPSGKPPGPPPSQAAVASAVSTTVSKLAEELGIEVTKTNERFLAELGVKEIKLRQVGKTQVRLKRVKEQMGKESGSTVSVVYAMMPGYAIWMCEEHHTKTAAGGKVGKAFVDMTTYDLYLRQTSDLRYVLQGGDYEPWPKADIHDPTVQVGWTMEAAAKRNMQQSLIERFPSDDEQDCNPFALQNHLDKHFQLKRIGLLTWEQLAAFRAHVLEETAYPPRWAEKEPPPRADGGVPYQGMDMEPSETAEELIAEEAAEEPIVGPDPFGSGEAAVEPPADVDHTEECHDMLVQIQARVGYEGDLVAFCEKNAILASTAVHGMIGVVYAAVMGGNLSDAKATEAMLSAALRVK